MSWPTIASDAVTATSSVRVEQVTSADGTGLVVYEAGDPTAPTVVLVHGFPDTHAMWDLVVAELSDRFHVVTFDVRGAGASGVPAAGSGYGLARLSEDLAAVLAAVSPDRPVHLVGHDWGSIHSWESVCSSDFEGRIASFTTISGPCLDHVGHWIRGSLARPTPARLAGLLRQGVASTYIALFQTPMAPPLLRLAARRMWPRFLRVREKAAPDAAYPAATFVADATHGLGLYRTDMLGRLRRPLERRTTVPVQLIVPTRDPAVTPVLTAELDQWVDRLWRREVAASHWVPRSRPALVSRWIGELVDHVEGGPESLDLRRARARRRSGPRFEGQVAVITGAGSGIGRAVAFELADQGAQLVLVDIDAGAVERSAELTRLIGAPTTTAVVDVSDATAMEELAAKVEAEHGAPDIVVNNAGIGISGAFLDTSPADWERTLGVNVWGVIHGSRLFARQMVDRGVGGHIVNVASAAAFGPSRSLPAYATSKSAVLMLTECLHAELVDEGIGVTAVCPGFVATNITRTTTFTGLDEAAQARRRRAADRLYRRRHYPPERVAERVVAAIGSDRAVLPVTPEAHGLRLLGRLFPACARRLARLSIEP